MPTMIDRFRSYHLKTLWPVVTLLSIVQAAMADAQPVVPRAQGRALSVLVIDESDQPIEAAGIELISGPRRMNALTDSVGIARFSNVVGDSVGILVRLIGFFPARISARLAELGENVTVFLNRQPYGLRAVEVHDNSPSSTRLADFEARLRSRTASASVTRAEIEHRNPVRLSQMLRGISGLRIADSLGSMVAISTRGMKSVPAGSGIALVPCVLRVMLDGIVLPALSDIDKVVPQDVHGVEVFFGAASVPPSLGGMRSDNWCGLIAIWTRSGGG